MFKLYCNKNDAFFQETAILTSGRVGEQISFTFSPDWDGLLKTAVFIAGKTSKDVVLTEDNCNIPPEVLVFPGEHLRVGVFGETADKTLVIPTIYASAGTIRPGASPSGMTSSPPSPSWTEQVHAIALEAKEVADSVRDDADAGKFNGQAGAYGGWYTPAVTQPDAYTIRMSFTPSKEDMPDVEPKDITLPAGGGGGGSSIAIDETLTKSGQAADAKTVGDRLDSLSEDKVNKSGWASDKYLGTDDSGNVVERDAPNGDSTDLPENLAYLQDVTVDEASGDFIPMLSPNGTEYRISIGDDGIPIIKNISGTTVWTGTSGGTGGDSGGDDATWTSGVAYALVPIAGGYISKTNGEVISDATWAYTDYMPCAGATRMTYNNNGYSSGYNAFYDINKTFISNFLMSTNAGSALEITVPENAAYFRISSNSEASVSNMTIIPYES